MATMLALGAMAFTPIVAGKVSFASIGDWGGAMINGGDYHKVAEVKVAEQMGKTSEELGVKFVLNTGDNFYYCGVQNITDEQFKVSFEDIYTDDSLMVPWYGVLGNHDYAYDVTAQFSYKSPNADRWQLPDYYYSKRINLAGSQYATVVFIDTNPCISSYRGDDPSGWDPCSGAYGECKETPDHTCHFHEHIVAQDCGKQLSWLKATLAAVPDDDWLLVVGHHEADYIDVEDFTEAMLDSKMALYLNGHTHAMKHYQIDGRTDVDFMTTGAGAMIHTHDQDMCIAGGGEGCAEVSRGHHAEEIIYKKVAAFSVHTFSDDFSTLTTKFVDYQGNVIHQFDTQKPRGRAASVREVVV